MDRSGPTLRTLLARLARVEALHRGATSQGEREAAAHARARILDHIARVRSADPVARFVEEHVASFGRTPPPPPPPAELPTVERVLRELARWEAGDLEGDDLAAWAAELVDTVELPTDPDDPGAAVAEVLLQLSSHDPSHPCGLAFEPADAAGFRRFLRTGDLAGWFAFVAEVGARGRRRRRSA